MNDRKTRVLLVAVITVSFSLTLGAIMRLYADRSTDINDVRLEAAHNLAEHTHPEMPSISGLLSIAGLGIGILSSLLLFIHKAQTDRQDRQGDDMRALGKSHDDLRSIVDQLVGRIDSDREWMHRELSGWKTALADTQAHTKALVEFTQRLKAQSS